MEVSTDAGKTSKPDMLYNVPKLITAYFTEVPDASAPEQQVLFGTSGHRSSSFNNSLNENHILAITQAICLYRRQQKITGPLLPVMDTHALSVPAFIPAPEVLAANGIDVMIAGKEEYTLRVLRGMNICRKYLKKHIPLLQML